jgi:hypothetical protein
VHSAAGDDELADRERDSDGIIDLSAICHCIELALRR